MRNFITKCLKAGLPKRQRGIVRVSGQYTGYLNNGKTFETIYEIEKVAQINNLTKIRIIDQSTNKEQLCDWIETSSIEWE